MIKVGDKVNARAIGDHVDIIDLSDLGKGYAVVHRANLSLDIEIRDFSCEADWNNLETLEDGLEKNAAIALAKKYGEDNCLPVIISPSIFESTVLQTYDGHERF